MLTKGCLLIDSLIEESSNLRRQLEAHGHEDVSMACNDADVSPSSSSEPEMTSDHSSADEAMASSKQ